MTSDQVRRMRRQEGSGEADRARDVTAHVRGDAPGTACDRRCRPARADMYGEGETA